MNVFVRDGTLSCIISTKTSKITGKSGEVQRSPGSSGKSWGGLRYVNKVSQNTFKSIPEDHLDMFFDIINYLTSNHREVRICPEFDEHLLKLKLFLM